MYWQTVGKPLKSTENRNAAEARIEPARLLVGEGEERLQEAELMHQLQRRGMDRIAAEIAKEISVFLENDDIDSGPRQQEAEHHPGRPAAGDRAPRSDRFRRHAAPRTAAIAPSHGKDNAPRPNRISSRRAPRHERGEIGHLSSGIGD